MTDIKSADHLDVARELRDLSDREREVTERIREIANDERPVYRHPASHATDRRQRVWSTR